MSFVDLKPVWSSVETQMESSTNLTPALSLGVWPYSSMYYLHYTMVSISIQCRELVEELAQLVTCLPHKHQDLNFISRTLDGQPAWPTCQAFK